MRKKELKLIVTFHTTADAMAMEKACREDNIPGRLIPVPREISAGCGLAWCALPDQRESLLTIRISISVMAENGIEQEDLHEIIF